MTAKLCPKKLKCMRAGVSLGDITLSSERQLDFLLDNDRKRQKWERLGNTMDTLNIKYGKTVASVGFWKPPTGGNVGGKIRSPESLVLRTFGELENQHSDFGPQSR